MNFLEFLTEKFKLTLQYHSYLNKKLWTKTTLHDGIADEVMKHALKYAKFCKIPEKKIKDIIITGGNVGYTYTKFSDIDAHLLIDLSDQDAEKFKEKQFDYKKKWSQSHDIKIEGYPLELFAADVTEKVPDGQGVYSVMHNAWVIIPEHQNWKEVIQNPLVMRKMEYAYDEAEDLIENGTAEQIEKFRDKLWRGRSAGLHAAGEFSIENLIYKNLRNLGTLEQLKKREEKLTGVKEIS